MLVDSLKIKLSAGKGGDGVVRWRREKSIAKGGPYGGDGGKGGDVYFRAIRDVYALGKYDANVTYKAKDGEPGGNRLCEGKMGEDLIFDIPVGSIVHNLSLDITTRFDTDGEVRLMLRGGKGGYGNDHFKSSTNQTPYEFEHGATGESADFHIEVEMIAQVGIIGFPNAGKSSLLNSLTRAKAKTANYAFTTLEPNLGDFYGFILADLPGLIEGAADGKGLGHKFLKHVKRTNTLLHLISAEEEDIVASYRTIRAELIKFDKDMANKKEILVVSKSDTVDEKVLAKQIKALEKETKNTKILTLSLYDDASIKKFSEFLLTYLQSIK
jgi:GTP-binding protein